MVGEEGETVRRKIHNHEAGYIAERKNPFFPDYKVVIYHAGEQSVDVGGLKYAVICDCHSTIVGSTNIPDARITMKNPDLFCEECRQGRSNEAP